MATQATYDDANLLLRLYELRRDETMRTARQWFQSVPAGSAEEFQKVAPMGSKENAYYRMVVSYWDMAASFVTSGVLNEDLFLQNNGELLFVWEKARPAIEATRAMMKNPNYCRNLETLGQAAIKRMGPDAYQTFSAMVKGMAARQS